MSIFDPSKLHIKYIPPATVSQPVTGRKYTLTHSDETGDLFLSIGNHYDLQAINMKNRDEVLAEWITSAGQIRLLGRVHITCGEYTNEMAKRRFSIFQKELPLALTAILYGDGLLFHYQPNLLDAQIVINFDSSLPQFHQSFYYGTPRNYLINQT